MSFLGDARRWEPRRVVVHVFRSAAFARNRDSVMCIGLRSEIDACLGPGVLADTFFGQASFSDEVGRAFIGVWGARNASRMRTMLRASGAQVAVQRGLPDGVTLRHFETHPGARARCSAPRVRQRRVGAAPTAC